MGWRKLEVDGVKYIWRGSDFVIVRNAETRLRVCSGRVTEIKPGATENTWERGHDKKTSDGMLFPGDVARWIRKRVNNGA